MKAGLAIEMLDLDDYNKTDLHEYQRLIGKLMYLICETRPDIVFAVSQLSKQNTDPRKGPFQAIKRVVKYLKGTMQMELIYRQGNSLSKNPSPFGLKGFADSIFASDLNYHNLVIGYYVFLNGAIVLWSSKKQGTVSISTTEVEYIALGYEAMEVV